MVVEDFVQHVTSATSSTTGQYKDVYDFIAQAPFDPSWSAEPSQHLLTYTLPDDSTIACIRWDFPHGPGGSTQAAYVITGTDVVRVVQYLLFAEHQLEPGHGRKFEEGIFSDLRQLKQGQHAVLQEARSPLLTFLFDHQRVRTRKKQKVFFWQSVSYPRLVQEAAEREQRRILATAAVHTGSSPEGGAVGVLNTSKLNAEALSSFAGGVPALLSTPRSTAATAAAAAPNHCMHIARSSDQIVTPVHASKLLSSTFVASMASSPCSSTSGGFYADTASSGSDLVSLFGTACAPFDAAVLVRRKGVTAVTRSVDRDGMGRQRRTRTLSGTSSRVTFDMGHHPYAHSHSSNLSTSHNTPSTTVPISRVVKEVKHMATPSDSTGLYYYSSSSFSGSSSTELSPNMLTPLTTSSAVASTPVVVAHPTVHGHLQKSTSGELQSIVMHNHETQLELERMALMQLPKSPMYTESELDAALDLFMASGGQKHQQLGANFALLQHALKHESLALPELVLLESGEGEPCGADHLRLLSPDTFSLSF